MAQQEGLVWLAWCWWVLHGGGVGRCLLLLPSYHLLDEDGGAERGLPPRRSDQHRRRLQALPRHPWINQGARSAARTHKVTMRHASTGSVRGAEGVVMVVAASRTVGSASVSGGGGECADLGRVACQQQLGPHEAGPGGQPHRQGHGRRARPGRRRRRQGRHWPGASQQGGSR